MPAGRNHNFGSGCAAKNRYFLRLDIIAILHRRTFTRHNWILSWAKTGAEAKTPQAKISVHIKSFPISAQARIQ